MENKEAIAEEIAELVILDFKYLSSRPLTYLFSNEENGDPLMETKYTTTGETLKKKVFNTILTILKENGTK